MIPIRDRNPSGTFPLVTVLLILANVLCFAAELRMGARVQGSVERLGVVPVRVSLFVRGDGRVPIGAVAVPFLASMFLHGGWLHLIGNMWYLWLFGDNVEDRFGHGLFLLFYLACGIAGSVAHIALHPSSPIPTIGASGAIAGVLGAYLVTFPRARIVTLVPLFFFWYFIELRAVFVLGFWFVIQVLNTRVALVQPGGMHVAWAAHVGGFLTGMALISIIPKRKGFRVPRPARR